MTLSDLIKLYRAQAVDEKDPPFCHDELLTLYANEAQDEACRRGQLLVDSTAPWCTVAVLADEESIPLNPLAIEVQRAFVDGHPMWAARVDVMDAQCPGWQFHATQARPTHLVSGLTTNALHLWPRPAQDCTIKLTVRRLPLRRMEHALDRPEIRHELHVGLVDWMLYRAFSRMDSELYDEAKAMVALGRFEAEFGRKASGRNEEWVRTGAGMMPGPIA